jgi:hypothetical protein
MKKRMMLAVGSLAAGFAVSLATPSAHAGVVDHGLDSPAVQDSTHTLGAVVQGALDGASQGTAHHHPAHHAHAPHHTHATHKGHAHAPHHAAHHGHQAHPGHPGHTAPGSHPGPAPHGGHGH